MKKILIVDDNDVNLEVLASILREAGYEPISINDSKMVRASVISNNPDLILLDVSMPDIDGFELCERLKKDSAIKSIPVIFISAFSDDNSIKKAFAQGAVDYITKPFKTAEVQVRVALHLKLHELQSQLEDKNRSLEKLVEQQVKLISEQQMETIFSLAKLAQSRDDDTGKHIERVQKYCYLLSVELAKTSVYKSDIDNNFIKNIVYASPLHDIGKVAIPDSILLKPGKLTPEEFEKMKLHTIYGAKTLEDVYKKFGTNKFIEMGKFIARNHHERWDGSGYPDKLKGEEIPLCARIMAIADVYDALATKRVYKDAFAHEKCVEIIKEGRGTQFDPVCVDAFLSINEEFNNARNKLADTVKE